MTTRGQSGHGAEDSVASTCFFAISFPLVGGNKRRQVCILLACCLLGMTVAVLCHEQHGHRQSWVPGRSCLPSRVRVSQVSLLWAGRGCVGGQPGAGLAPLASKKSLRAGGGGHMLAADIWRIRKLGVRRPWLLTGAFGLGSGGAGYQPATLAPSRLDLPNPVFLKKQTHSLVEQCTQFLADHRQHCAPPAPLCCQ